MAICASITFDEIDLDFVFCFFNAACLVVLEIDIFSMGKQHETYRQYKLNDF